MSESPLAPAPPRLTILYATETGNASDLAELAAKAASEAGLAAKAIDMATYNTAGLARERDLLVIASTHGEGDPPYDAQDFFEDLEEPGLDLSGVRFTVLALGDSGYERFCEAGKRLESRLIALGARRIRPRTDVDVDELRALRKHLDEVVAVFAEAQAAAPV